MLLWIYFFYILKAVFPHQDHNIKFQGWKLTKKKSWKELNLKKYINIQIKLLINLQKNLPILKGTVECSQLNGTVFPHKKHRWENAPKI
jgi:hypothetical protein